MVVINYTDAYLGNYTYVLTQLLRYAKINKITHCSQPRPT